MLLAPSTKLKLSRPSSNARSGSAGVNAVWVLAANLKTGTYCVYAPAERDDAHAFAGSR